VERRIVLLLPGLELRPQDNEKSVSIILQNVGQTYFENKRCFTWPIEEGVTDVQGISFEMADDGHVYVFRFTTL
jgi:hypothetical protein